MAAPLLPTLAPDLFKQYAGKNGKLSAQEARRAGIAPPPKGQQYTYNHGSQSLGLKKDGNEFLGKLGDVAKVAVPVILAATGVGAPAAAAIMAATYAADKKADGGSWGDAAKSGVVGGVAGYAGAGGLSSTGGKVAAQAGAGAVQGSMDGGGMKGAVLGAAGGAAGGAMGAGGATSGAAGQAGGSMANSGAWGDILKSLAKDPETYKAIASVAGKAGQGAAAERAGQNNFATDQSRTDTSRYGIDQGSRSSLAGLQERATMDRAQFGHSSRSSNAKQALLGSMLANMRSVKATPPAGVRMAGGGIDLDALLKDARQAGGSLNRQATSALDTGSDIPGATDYMQTGAAPKPSMPEYKNAGGMESALSNSGLLASLMGALQKQGTPQGAPPITAPPKKPNDIDLGINAF